LANRTAVMAIDRKQGKRSKIVIVAGTRPEVIKLAPVYNRMNQEAIFDPIFVSSGQHREMLHQTLKVFGINPDVDLDVMSPNQSLSQLMSRVVTKMTRYLHKVKPYALLVQGDTTTAFAAALAAFYVGIPVGHVEAGLRTYNFEAPWPEEMNRRLIAPIAYWCFAPTTRARDNLLAERIPSDRIYVTGNTIIDALFWVKNGLQNSPCTDRERAIRCGLSEHFTDWLLGRSDSIPEVKSSSSGRSRKIILVTGHRRESFGEGLKNVCKALLEIVRRNTDVGLVYSVHLNPNVHDPVKRLLRGHARIQLIEPVSYDNLIWLMGKSYFILTDSGGVQEEAPNLGKPVLVTRIVTERHEGIEAGTCLLVGTDLERIVTEAERLLEDQTEYAKRCAVMNPYGDGRAAERITEILKQSVSAGDLGR
jgi:UDP-N-acetylglucosamine 2-epimerase (non-hydrolysing)